MHIAHRTPCIVLSLWRYTLINSSYERASPRCSLAVAFITMLLSMLADLVPVLQRE